MYNAPSTDNDRHTFRSSQCCHSYLLMVIGVLYPKGGVSMARPWPLGSSAPHLLSACFVSMKSRLGMVDRFSVQFLESIGAYIWLHMASGVVGYHEIVLRQLDLLSSNQTNVTCGLHWICSGELTQVISVLYFIDLVFNIICKLLRLLYSRFWNYSSSTTAEKIYSYLEAFDVI